MLKAIEVKPDVFWVGGIDWTERNFHGYTTDRGSTYNAYLIIDEKITLIDTCKPPFADELLERISDIIDPAKIDYVISNHVEQDHSGAIPRHHGGGPERHHRYERPARAQRPSSPLRQRLHVPAGEDGATRCASASARSRSRQPSWCTGPTTW